jgi:quercetin dioxygenase-like cupin family protein
MSRILLALLVLLAQGTRTVPVEQEPRHTVKFADSVMRVLDVDIPGGDTTLEHRHVYDIATVCLECAATRTKPPGGEWSGVRTRTLGSVNVTQYRAKPDAHTVQNLEPAGGAHYHLVAVENLGPGGFEIKELTLKPDEDLAPHRHARPTVVVRPGAGTFERAVEIIKPGQVHAIDNGSGPMGVVEIEVR